MCVMGGGRICGLGASLPFFLFLPASPFPDLPSHLLSTGFSQSFSTFERQRGGTGENMTTAFLSALKCGGEKRLSSGPFFNPLAQPV